MIITLHIYTVLTIVPALRGWINHDMFGPSRGVPLGKSEREPTAKAL